MRLVAYGQPAAVAAWRTHVLTTPGRPRLSSDPVTSVKLAGVRVERFAGSASADLTHIATLATPGVSLLALWRDEHSTRHWVHIRDGQVTDLDVAGDRFVHPMLSHGGKFRLVMLNARTQPTAAAAIAAYVSPMDQQRASFITFDVNGVWTPDTHPAPAGTRWDAGALDITDVTLGAYLSTDVPASQFAWERWAVDALAVWLNHERVRACDVPHLVAATAGLPIDSLAPLLAERIESASDVIGVVRALAEQRLTIEQITRALPGLLA